MTRPDLASLLGIQCSRTDRRTNGRGRSMKQPLRKLDLDAFLERCSGVASPSDSRCRSQTVHDRAFRQRSRNVTFEPRCRGSATRESNFCYCFKGGQPRTAEARTLQCGFEIRWGTAHTRRRYRTYAQSWSVHARIYEEVWWTKSELGGVGQRRRWRRDVPTPL